ncbi:MAG: TetR family transcriptional regulator [Synergistaceae bacterium]|nr:TetR family transcriptional regulator [Synergistaceae bacterium]
MPRGSEKLTNARKEEIISACASLYETRSFRDITLNEISERTSFSRPSIYNYFQTKEEIFLALHQKEYEEWTSDLEKIIESNEKLTADELARELAHSLEKRERLLKLMSMNHYDMEANSRLERLTEFKTAYGKSMKAVVRCLDKFCPRMTAKDRQEFIYAFFPFIYGVYPYTAVTEKQREAMKAAGIDYAYLSIYELVYADAKKLLQH